MSDDAKPSAVGLLGWTPDAPGPEQLAAVVEMMRELSRQTDPNKMVTAYAQRVRALVRLDGTHSLSRRGLAYPSFRVTRSTSWTTAIDPWRERDRLPLLKGGLFADLLYADEPRLIDPVEIKEDDPAYEYLRGMGSLIAIPHYEDGAAINMVVHTRRDHGAFHPQELAQFVLTSNLFGRATKNLVLNAQLREAVGMLDRELKTVGEIQRALLPDEAPRIATLDIAAQYQTSTRAGGDYYDFFKLAGGKWGILIADVSGHGAPAAVLMAILHAIAHLMPGEAMPPGHVLEFCNRELVRRYTGPLGSFVTAFYAVFEESTRRLTYACAGHPPPLIRRAGRCGAGSAVELDTSMAEIPLGIETQVSYGQGELTLGAGDVLLLYTDGISEAFAPDGAMYGVPRLKWVLESCHATAAGTRDAVFADLKTFCGDRPAGDDRTLVVAGVR